MILDKILKSMERNVRFLPERLIIILYDLNFVVLLSTPIFFMHVFLGVKIYILFFIIIFILNNKDFFGSKSIAKRNYGYQVIDIKNNMPANELKCYIRNITWLIWPIEVIIALLSPNRRLGDFIAGTKIIKVEPENPKTIFEEMKNYKFSKNIFINIILTILITLIQILIFFRIKIF